MHPPYRTDQPERAAVDSMPGAVLLDFGTNWCGHCQAGAPAVEQALQSHLEVRHLKVEDGPGLALGRSFGVKLWPTLVLLRDGQELGRVVRPRAPAPVAELLARLAPAAH